MAGLTIINGYGPTETIRALTLSLGGAIYCTESSPTISHCRFVDNLADDYGGGVYCRFAPATISDCTFSNNEGGAGGAIYCESSNAAITGCTFTGNISLSHGGAICCYYGSPSISNCTFEGNSSLSTGGAIFSQGSSGAITDCNIIDNASAMGGAVFGLSTLAGCTIADNSAECNGGAIYIPYYNAEITGCTISNNTSGADGGGIYAYGHQFCWGPGMPPVPCGPDIRSCIITNNKAYGDGGGIHYTSYAAPGLTLCTLAGNQFGGLGGGVFCDDTTYVWINSCILWGNTPLPNTAGQGPQLALRRKSEGTPSRVEIRYSNVQGSADEVYLDPNCIGIDGPGNIDLDPGFVDPDGADDDPNTWQDNDYHLAAGSWCINRGDPSGDYAGQTDIDGEPRVADGRADIGADEFPNALSDYYYVLDLRTKNTLDDGSVHVEPNDPNDVPYTYLAGTPVTLTAVPRAFGFWRLFDPNYPGNASYATTDANNPITIIMNADRQVTAVFDCGGGTAPIAPLVLGTLLIYGPATRRPRRRA